MDTIFSIHRHSTAGSSQFNLDSQSERLPRRQTIGFAVCVGTLLFFLGLPGNWLSAQGSLQDYERSASLRERFQDKIFRHRVDPNWWPGNTSFWYRVQTGPNSTEYVRVEALAGRRSLAFDHAKLANALREAGVDETNADGLELSNLQLDSDSNTMEFHTDGKTWRCWLETYELEAIPSVDAAPEFRPWSELPERSRSTGGETWVTFVNMTSGDVILSWLNTQGERVDYGTIQQGQHRRQHTFAGHVWIVTDTEGRDLAWCEGEHRSLTLSIYNTHPRPIETRRRRGQRRNEEAREIVSPDGTWTAFIQDHNVVLREVSSRSEFLMSQDGTETDGYRPLIIWAPDSKSFVAIRREKGDEREVTLIESSPDDQLQPKLHTYHYAKPGDRVAIDRPQLFNIAGKKHIQISDDLFQNPWSIRDIRWADDSSRFTFLYNQRGHQILRIVVVDATNGAVRALVEEESPTFIDYAGKFFSHWTKDTDELIWMSERDGWNHLYLYDTRIGTVKNQITCGEWVVREVEHVDEQKRQICFTAGGIIPGQDPYFLHHARINFDGTGLTLLTEGHGAHEVSFSPDRSFLVDTWSRVDQPPVTELRDAESGRLIVELERSDLGALHEAQWRSPEPFLAKGRDGTTDIYGIIIRPTNFDPNQKYPVIEHIYAGPQSAFVPKSFRAYYDFQSMAELGFIVVKIDGMGTSHRSKAFHDVCWKNLGDGGFPDRIAWMEAAAAKYPEMDLTRVGIYGGSAGGQNALRAMLAHGDFYMAAAADCGCHDNRMDKIWWNELWMGWPIGDHYEEQSNVTQAHKLQGKLLLTVGELDRNVDPSSTLQVVDALIKADKDFEFLIVPGAGHGVGERSYPARRRADFFVRNLLGREPRWTP